MRFCLKTPHIEKATASRLFNGLQPAIVIVAVMFLGAGAVVCAEEPGSASKLSKVHIPAPTLGGVQFWADELFFHGWRIQRNTVTGDCRLLDANNIRHAKGTFESCRQTLDEIRVRKQLPPMQGTGVLLLHGLADTRGTMTRLGKYIDQHSDFTVFNVTYPSMRQGIEDHARSLARIVENLDGIERIHFVGHSMGNIVVRRYLADLAKQADLAEQADPAAARPVDERFGRMVMLGPPNHGSVAAVNLEKNRLFRAIVGESGKQLGREWVWLESHLAVPRFEFGILAGGLGTRQGFNPLLPGDNDGVVTVQSTRLAGARDFLILPVLHTLMPASRRMQECTLRFLEEGHFIAADRRRPIGEKQTEVVKEKAEQRRRSKR